MSLVEIEDKYKEFRIGIVLHSMQQAYLKYKTLKEQKCDKSLLGKSLAREIRLLRLSVSLRMGKLEWFAASMYDPGVEVAYGTHSCIVRRVEGNKVIISVEKQSYEIEADPKNIRPKYLTEQL